MLSKVLLVWTTYVVINCVAEEYGTCDQPFNIFKNTKASSDSERECKNGYNIFPYIADEGANKFHDGECAYQCKLQLPSTCFAIHAPQTMQHNEGLLAVHILEKKMTEKWKNVLDAEYEYKYDSFLDFNMAFYVQSLDDYILHWKQYNDDSVELETLEYIGIEWYHYDNDKKCRFYSLLIHSPNSAINYEFMSQKKPAIDLYEDIKWIQSDMTRCSFKAMNDPFPWDRNDNALIVPVRISHSVSNIAAIYDFYVNVMDAKLLYNSYQMKPDIDAETAETVSFSLKNTEIELQFIKRPSYYTFGDFTLELYENLLMETHSAIITSPYCGIDRWFDNHYGYDAYSIDGFMDRMIVNLKKKNMVYRLYKLSYEHSSVFMKKELDLHGYSWQYGAIVIDPTGQTIEVNGYISDTQMQGLAPVANPQWCSSSCNGDMVEGDVDPSHIYVDVTDDIAVGHGDDMDIIIMKEENGEHRVIGLSVLQLIVIISGVTFCMSCVICIAYYCCCRRRLTRYIGHEASSRSYKQNEITPLMAT